MLDKREIAGNSVKLGNVYTDVLGIILRVGEVYRIADFKIEKVISRYPREIVYLRNVLLVKGYHRKDCREMRDIVAPNLLE